jgi:hypothetical protein
MNAGPLKIEQEVVGDGEGGLEARIGRIGQWPVDSL